VVDLDAALGKGAAELGELAGMVVELDNELPGHGTLLWLDSPWSPQASTGPR
jgi:hypothetical protein